MTNLELFWISSHLLKDSDTAEENNSGQKDHTVITFPTKGISQAPRSSALLPVGPGSISGLWTTVNKAAPGFLPPRCTLA